MFVIQSRVPFYTITFLFIWLQVCWVLLGLGWCWISSCDFAQVPLPRVDLGAVLLKVVAIFLFSYEATSIVEVGCSGTCQPASPHIEDSNFQI